MSQWQQLSELDAALQERVLRLYDGNVLFNIRRCFSVWIESQDWDSAALDGDTARSCFHRLLAHMEEQWTRSVQDNAILQGPDFSTMIDCLRKQCEKDPQFLARLFSHFLSEEKKILASASKPPQASSNPDTEQNRQMLDNLINKLTAETLEVKKEINALEDLNEKLDYVQKTRQSLMEQRGRLAQSQAETEEDCLNRATFITQTKQILLKHLGTILERSERAVSAVTGEELSRWRRGQQLACIGGPADGSLHQLQQWFTRMAEVLLGVREQLQRLKEQSQRYDNADASTVPKTLASIHVQATSLLTRLLAKALVVQKQPVMTSQPQRPQILKTKVRFKVTLRFLVNLPEFKGRLKVKPVFDKDVEEVKTVPGFRLFEFTNSNSKVLDADTQGGALTAEFGNMCVREKESRVKGASENQLVAEELHVIKFVTTLQLHGQTFDIETSSLPLVVVTSTSQFPSAWASVMWCNMASSSSEPWNLSLFADPPPLSWQQLAQALSWQFLSVGQRELDDHQLASLRTRLVDGPDGLVQWNTFSKNENAWVWIDGILDLIKKHLADLWRDGSIMGFVSKEKTRSMLLKKPPGTFLLRFSESNKDGAITFSWVDDSCGEKRVHAVEPYTKKELQALSLPDIIYHYSLTAQQKTSNPLLYLYPDTHKDAAFGRYYQVTETKNVDGYVHRKLISSSVDPSPPASPFTEPMEAEQDMDTGVPEDAFSSDPLSPGSSQLFHVDPLSLHPPSPLLDPAASGRFH